jgi:putative transposase
LSDRRREAAAARVPANKLSPEERKRVLDGCNVRAYQSLPPSQIMPRLVDEGDYMASWSTF